MWMETALEIWQDLRERYYQGDIFRISELLREIHTYKQGNLGVGQYFSHIKGLWQELDNFRTMPPCSCNCTLAPIVRTYRENDYVICFLKGLNDQYESVRSQIMLMDPLPTINKAFSLLTQQERHIHSHYNEPKVLMNANADSTNEFSSNRGRGRGRPFHNLAGRGSYNQGRSGNNFTRTSGGRSSKMCTYCNKTGHTVDQCYKKHGFPPGYFKNNNVNNLTTMDEFSHGDEVDTEIKEQAVQSSTSQQSDHTVNNFNTHFDNSKCKGNLYMFACSSKSLEWIIDTGATDHACHTLSLFQTFKRIKPILVTLPNGNQILASISGSVMFSKHLVLTDVLYIPTFHYNLVSVSKLTKALCCRLIFLENFCEIQDLFSMKMIGVADLKAGLYAIRNHAKCIMQPLDKQYDQYRISSFTGYDSNIWHNRLGHLSHEKMTIMQKHYPVVKCNKIDSPCHVCHLAKQKRLPYNSSMSKSAHIFDLLHMDIWGPFSMPSTLGHRYFLTIVDDKSRFTWLYFMKVKSEVPDLIRNFSSLVNTQFGLRIKSIRSDNDKEFCLNEFYAKNGIEHQTSCVETPQQNGIVERKHQHILGVARSLVFQSDLPHCLWNYATSHAVFLINRQPTKYLSNRSPYNVLYNSLPNISNIKVFGCLCYASTLTSHRKKLDHRSRKCIFLGLKQGVKGYILMDVNTHEIFLSRNTIFYEHIFPYKNVAEIRNHPDKNVEPRPVIDKIYAFTPNEAQNMVNQPFDHAPQTLRNYEDSSVQNYSDHGNNLEINDVSQEQTSSGSEIRDTNDPKEYNSPMPRHSLRPRQKPHYLEDYHCSMIASTDMDSYSKIDCSNVKYPLSSSISYNRLSHDHRNYSMNISSNSEPTTYHDAIKFECWRNAIDKELKALEDNKTWTITTLPSNKRAIGCKWVFKIKYRSDGSIERYKARLVAKGFTQTEGVDFLETFSPVIKMTTIRVILSMASAYKWHIHQLDINTAFLHGELKERVYMRVPFGVHVEDHKLVCKLEKSIYGLRQASRQWHDKLTGVLIHSGYVKSNADYSMFIKAFGSNFTAILIYVDDLILTGNDILEIDRMKHLLNSEFSIKDLGNLKFFLGMEIARSAEGILLYQRKYTLDLLQETGMLAAKPCSTPMEYSIKLIHSKSGDLLPNPSTYRRLIGKFVYLTQTRPDLSFAVGHLSQFLSAPTDEHLKAAMRILRYIKSTIGIGIFFPSSSDFKVKGYTDADWGACIDTRRSVSGYCFYIGNSLICWKSKKQKTVSRSSAEAEYRALALAACEAQWLMHLLSDLKVNHSDPIVLYCDNQSALHIATNPVFHERTKHIDIDCHSVRERIQSDIIHLLPISTVFQVADIFTKALSPQLFKNFHSKLGMLNIHMPACGGLLKGNALETDQVCNKKKISMMSRRKEETT
ncbi:unnamed protein product [Lupinus luteus]|uniref:Integrase catalytic domain-containing protein n=1 Tax=Lupinus luteus TaxID=3873 RepID=A0AAV1VSI3_LUPLU